MPVYNPYVSVLDDYRSFGLYMEKIEQPIPRHYVLYHFQLVINQLRAGSRLNAEQQSVGFQLVRQASPPPHIESAQNLLFGKPKADQSSYRCLSVFDSQQSENKDQFFMPKQETLNLLDNTFTGSKIISETEKISDWQRAKRFII